MFKYRFSVYIVIILWASAVQAQDPMRDQKITALIGLKDVQLVVRENVKLEVLSRKEIHDTVELNLRQRIPQLELRDHSENWLEISYIIHREGALVEISLYRWVMIIATGKRVYSKVWDDKLLILGQIQRNTLRESLDSLLISFSVDFMRAN